MKTTRSALQVVAGLVALAALALILILVFQGMSGGGRAPLALQTEPVGYPLPGTAAPVPSPTELPQGYPPPPSPPPTLSLTEAAAYQATMEAVATAHTEKRKADATASAPAIFTPLPDGRLCYIDSLNRFSLLLPIGWQTDPPPSENAIASATVIYNYDARKLGNEGGFPLDGLKIQISSSRVSEGQSIDRWVQDLISLYTSSENSAPLTATQPIPYTIASYDGLSFIFTGQGFSSMQIVLPVSDARVLIIGLMPTESSALQDGLTMLATLNASGEAACYVDIEEP